MVSQLTLTRFDRELSNCYEAFVALDIIDVITYLQYTHIHFIHYLPEKCWVLCWVLGFLFYLKFLLALVNIELASAVCGQLLF